jgi:P pilus assembly chaperone PapD
MLRAAAAQVSVEVSPLRVELSATPGATTTQAVTLNNQGTQPVRIRARVDDWHLARDGAPQFGTPAPDGRFSASAWIRLAPPEQVVDGGKDGIVRFTVTVPAGTADAGYRSAIMFEFAPPGADLVGRGRDVLFKSRIATLVYVNVGSPRPAVELADLRGRTRPTQPAEVVATLHNTSRATVRTKGSLTVYDAGGRLVRQLPLPDVPILPESEREIAIVTAREGEQALPAGEYRVEVKIDVGLPALLVGETTLTLAR